MTRTRHLSRSAVVVAASALFAVAGAGTAALAFNEGSIVQTPTTGVAVVSAPAPTAAELAAPAKAHAAAHVELARTAAEAAAKAAAAKAAAAKAAAAKKAAARKAAAAQAAAAKAAAAKTQKASSTRQSSGKTIYIGKYSNGGGQAAIDKCQLVLWYTSPMWLAAHNYCGYQWMAFVPTGTTVVVTRGAAAGTYKVTDHMRLTRQGGSMPSVNADLVLQTCVGSGTGLTLLQRV